MAGGTETQVRDRLAWQRTVLANERTLLAYIRTALGFFIAGIPAVWWPDQPAIHVLGGVSGRGSHVPGHRNSSVLHVPTDDDPRGGIVDRFPEH